MTATINTEDGTKEVPTVSEFIPGEQIDSDRNMLRYLQATEDGGLEVAAHEPYDDTVENRVYICDQCGHDESTENAIAHHVEHNH